MKRLAIGFSFAMVLGLGAGGAVYAQESDRDEFRHQAEAGAGSTVLWKTINFVLLAGVLGYLIYKRGGPYFAARSEGIRRGLEEAAKLKAEAEARYREIDERLANLEAEIEGLRRHAHEESAAEGERVRHQIETDLRKISAQAEHDIAAAGKAARKELRVYSAELAIGLAERKIRSRLTPEIDDELVESMVNNLERQQAVRAS